MLSFPLFVLFSSALIFLLYRPLLSFPLILRPRGFSVVFLYFHVFLFHFNLFFYLHFFFFPQTDLSSGFAPLSVFLFLSLLSTPLLLLFYSLFHRHLSFSPPLIPVTCYLFILFFILFFFHSLPSVFHFLFLSFLLFHFSCCSISSSAIFFPFFPSFIPVTSSPVLSNLFLFLFFIFVFLFLPSLMFGASWFLLLTLFFLYLLKRYFLLVLYSVFLYWVLFFHLFVFPSSSVPFFLFVCLLSFVSPRRSFSFIPLSPSFVPFSNPFHLFILFPGFHVFLFPLFLLSSFA